MKDTVYDFFGDEDEIGFRRRIRKKEIEGEGGAAILLSRAQVSEGESVKRRLKAGKTTPSKLPVFGSFQKENP